MAGPQSGFVPLREYVAGVTKEAHQCLVTVLSCWKVYSIGGVGRAVQVGTSKVPCIEYRCKIVGQGGRCRAMLRLLKPRPSDVEAIRQLDIPEFTVWKSVFWHSTDHEGLFFDPEQCLTMAGPQEIQDRELGFFN